MPGQVVCNATFSLAIDLIIIIIIEYSIRSLTIVNDLVAPSFASAGVPVSKEPVGLLRSDGKRPDGVILSSLGRAANLCAGMSL